MVFHLLLRVADHFSSVLNGAAMNRKIVFAAIFAALAISAQSAEGQRRTRGRMHVAPTPGPSISPYAGYMMFGDIVDGPLGTSLTSSSGSVFGEVGRASCRETWR